MLSLSSGNLDICNTAITFLLMLRLLLPVDLPYKLRHLTLKSELTSYQLRCQIAPSITVTRLGYDVQSDPFFRW
jgi:hypothetical protein